jgi:hypothetical protein
MPKRTCTIGVCKDPVFARNRCRKHYNHWYHNESNREDFSREAKFWAKVNAQGVCWEWTGPQNKGGYGRDTSGPRGSVPRPAVHVAWEYLVGPVPAGLQPDHLCRNRLCVNPDHIEWVPGRINNNRGGSPSANNARKTHCSKGHKFTPENTYTLPNGARSCRICRSNASSAWKKRNPEKVAATQKRWREK